MPATAAPIGLERLVPIAPVDFSTTDHTVILDLSVDSGEAIIVSDAELGREIVVSAML